MCFAGDGDFLMSGQELATAVQYELPLVVLVVNNGMYGTIRMHQERHYPGRVFGTDLVNPDFARYARAFGGHGEVVERTEEFAPAFERRVASGRPAVIELRVDPGGDHAARDAEQDPRRRPARQVTRTSDRRLERDHHRGRAATGPPGPLHGKRLLVKDLIDTAGIRTTYGSKIYADHVPTRTAPAVERLVAAGAVVVGKANLHEFAWGVRARTRGTGRCRTRRIPGRTTGGSSGGNAAALVAGLCDLGLATDTGCSIRLPPPAAGSSA